MTRHLNICRRPQLGLWFCWFAATYVALLTFTSVSGTPHCRVTFTDQQFVACPANCFCEVNGLSKGGAISVGSGGFANVTCGNGNSSGCEAVGISLITTQGASAVVYCNGEDACNYGGFTGNVTIVCSGQDSCQDIGCRFGARAKCSGSGSCKGQGGCEP